MLKTVLYSTIIQNGRNLAQSPGVFYASSAIFYACAYLYGQIYWVLWFIIPK